jgi:hypothetical protein
MKKFSSCFLFFLVTSSKLFAYPQNIAHGYTSCATCHVNPSGGGRTNAYGHLSLESLIPDKANIISWMSNYREVKEKTAVTGYNKKREPELQFNLGGSFRSLLLYQKNLDDKITDSLTLIPMLMEAQAYALRGDFSIYGTFSILSIKNRMGKRFIKPFSREHWLMYQKDYMWFIRLGRMSLPFGIKTADHTRETRSLVNLHHSDQYYGFSLDYISEKFSFNFMPFIGNYLKYKPNPKSHEEKGAVLTFKLAKPTTFSIGLSSLFKRNERNYNELDHSINAAFQLPLHTYLLFEMVHQAKFEEKFQQKWASFLRVGKYFYEWIDAYGEFGEIRTENFKPYLIKVRLGLKGKFFPWLEVEPFVEYNLDKGEFFETSPSPSLKKFIFAFQAHAYY